MARIRYIKPGFFNNEDLIEMDPLARLLFIGMWTIADREGRLPDRPKRIKVQVLPGDNCDADELLQALADKGFILRYEVDGERYIQIVTFKKHQNPHKDEKQSIIPPSGLYDGNTLQASYKHHSSPARSWYDDDDSNNTPGEETSSSLPRASMIQTPGKDDANTLQTPGKDDANTLQTPGKDDANTIPPDLVDQLSELGFTDAEAVITRKGAALVRAALNWLESGDVTPENPGALLRKVIETGRIPKRKGTTEDPTAKFFRGKFAHLVNR